MPTYTYRARDAGGKALKGVMEADSPEVVAERLGRAGHLPVSVREQGGSSQALERLAQSFRRVGADELTLFTRELATLFRAGIPILTALHILQEQTRGPFLREILGNVSQEVQAGRSLSDALARFPRAFPGLYVSTVRAGETAGTLSEVLERLSDLMEQEQTTRREVKAALRYPLLVVVALGVAFLVITTVVMPKFVVMYQALDVQLPLPTRVMIGLNAFLRQNWIALVVVAVAVVGGLAGYVRTGPGRLRLDGLKLRTPIVGVLFLQAILSRFAHMFETLNRSGLPMMDTLRIVADTIGNAVVSQEMEGVLDGVKEGRGVSVAMHGSPLFPPLVVQMIALGEEAGALDDMLREISRHYDRELSYGTRRLASLIEPVLTVGLGLIVLFMLLAVYLPWWGRIGAIQGE